MNGKVKQNRSEKYDEIKSSRMFKNQFKPKHHVEKKQNYNDKMQKCRIRIQLCIIYIGIAKKNKTLEQTEKARIMSAHTSISDQETY